jgi:type IX secretion system PorP/SprF family membrane protein
MAYYAYRIKLSRSVVSWGLRGGAKLYSADYDQLNLSQQNDPGFAHNVSNAFLPNFGAGAFWCGKDVNQEDNFYLGLSVPNLLQNYYDQKGIKINNVAAREIRGYYLSGGLVLPLLAQTIKVEPQFILRYAGNSTYHLPVSCDLNLSAIYNNWVMLGGTYRTDKSLEFVVHLQVARELNIGYAYDYLLSPLSGYAGGSHELVLGYDIVRKNSKYINPRFTRSF